MTQPIPSVGRIVHYHSYGTPAGEFAPASRAAIITETGRPGTVGLCVLNPTGMYFARDVPYATQPTPGHWHWPPRLG